jgi:Flp pilus assembly pilin Flp
LSYGKTLANVASMVIIALFAIAALDQLHIAQNVINALLYATLTALVGVVIVAVGGGGISTMSSRWEKVSAKYDEEKDNMRQQIQSAPGVREQAQQAKQKAQSPSSDGPGAHQN